jgi:hypothetical protein
MIHGEFVFRRRENPVVTKRAFAPWRFRGTCEAIWRKPKDGESLALSREKAFRD